MQLTIFNRELEEIGMIEKFSSLLWNRKIKSCGDFSMVCGLEYLELLQKNNIVMLRDNEEVGIVLYRNITINNEGKSQLEIKGQLSKTLLSRRIVWGTEILKGSADYCLKTIINHNCINPKDENRRIPKVSLQEMIEIGKSLDYQVSYENILTECENICTLGDIGYEVKFNRENREFMIQTINGVDKTINQDINPQIVFSRKFDNVKAQSYTDSIMNYKNVALVGGVGEGSERIMSTTGGEASGLDRFEVFCDQRSLTKTGENDQEITDADYILLLDEKGRSVLDISKPNETFTLNNIVQSNIKYLQDYDLGDIVTSLDEEWNICLDAQIIGVNESYVNGKTTINLTVGNDLPTILDKLKKGVF